MEFAAELHDLIASDIRRHFGPQLARMARITIYDVAPTILGSFDRSLAKYLLHAYEGTEKCLLGACRYAEKKFQRDGIIVKLQHHVEKVEQVGALLFVLRFAVSHGSA